jgi:uncharacterized protein (UPF0297 family)
MAVSPLTPTGEAQQELIEQLRNCQAQLRREIEQQMNGAYYALNDKGHEVQQKMGYVTGLDIAVSIIQSYFNQRAEQKEPTVLRDETGDNSYQSRT